MMMINELNKFRENRIVAEIKEEQQYLSPTYELYTLQIIHSKYIFLSTFYLMWRSNNNSLKSNDEI